MHDQWAFIEKSGFDGADLRIRDGGHVEPDVTGIELPEAINTLQNLSSKKNRNGNKND